jgi:hypothetical protein
MGFTAGGALGQQRLQSGRRAIGGAIGAIVQATPLGLAGPAPRGGVVVVGRIGSRPAAERVDQSQRVADARQPRQRLGIRLG